MATKSSERAANDKRISTNRECSVCGKQFKQKSQRDNHYALVHSKELAFSCIRCHKGFVLRQHISRHLLKCGRSVARFRCMDCNLQFASASKLESHRVHMHPNSPRYYQCTVAECSSSFALKSRLRAHQIKVHDASKVPRRNASSGKFRIDCTDWAD